MSSPLPVIQVLVGFNNGPLDDPATITTIATPAGTLGAHNAWTDITPYVPDITVHRGRQHELQQFEAGTLVLTKVNNNDGRFNPWNTSSPYAGKIVPMVPIQVRATRLGATYYLFTGHINSWQPKWDDPVSQFIDIQAADAFRVLDGALLASLSYQNQVIADGASHLWPLSDPPGTVNPADVVAGASGTVTNSSDGYNGTPLICTLSGPGTGPVLAQSSGYFSTGKYYSDTQNVSGFTPNYLSVPGLNTSGSFSVEAWLRIPSGIFSGGFQPYLAGQNVLGSSSWWHWEIKTGNVLEIIVNNSGGTSTFLDVNWPTDGRWHHVVMTYTSSALVAYIDGVQAGTSAASGNPVLTSGQTTTIGEIAVTGTQVAGGTDWSNVAFYNTNALTPSQVANHYSLGIGLGGAGYGTVSTQIQQALAIVGWPSGAEDILASVQQAANNTQSLIATSALSALQVLERTEEGALFMSGAGKVTFRDRQTIAGANAAYPQYAQPQVYFGDDVANPATVATWVNGGTGNGTWDSGVNHFWGTLSARYDPGDDLGLDELDVVNQAVVTRVGGVAQVANNPISQTTYGLKSSNVSNVLHVTDAASAAHAQWIVNKLSAAVFRVRSLLVNLIDAIGEDTVANTPGSGQTYSRVGQLLGLDLMYWVRVGRVSSGLQQDALVERIQHKITANGWDMTLGLSTSDTYRVWGWGAQ